MPATNYKIWNWGGPVGQGVMQSVKIGVAGIGKCGSVNSPFAVPFELICANLGRAVLLPIPPSFIVRNDENVPYHVSLHHGLAGEALPPADPAEIVASLPNETCGTILFDIFVGNFDRHSGNLAYFEEARELVLFDHSHAVLPPGQQANWLIDNQATVHLGNHCLRTELVNVVPMSNWLDRFSKVPDYFIRELVADTARCGLTAELVAPIQEFLLRRRDNLRDLLLANVAVFPNVPAAAWAMI